MLYIIAVQVETSSRYTLSSKVRSPKIACKFVVPLDICTQAKIHDIAQAVSCRILTAKARAHVQVSPCGFCGGQTGNEMGSF
jgi:hypothetical protein